MLMKSFRREKTRYETFSFSVRCDWPCSSPSWFEVLILIIRWNLDNNSSGNHTSPVGSGDLYEGSGGPIDGNICAFEDTFTTTILECTPEGINLSIKLCAFENAGIGVDEVFMGGIENEACQAWVYFIFNMWNKSYSKVTLNNSVSRIVQSEE